MKGKKNSKVFILVFLGMLTAFGPFVTDMYLPTLPACRNISIQLLRWYS